MKQQNVLILLNLDSLGHIFLTFCVSKCEVFCEVKCDYVENRTCRI